MQEIIEKLIREKQEEIKNLKEFSAEDFFRKCQEAGLERFSWTQYTPYFNDGEECIFRINEEIVNIKLLDSEEEYDDTYGLWLGSWNNEKYVTPCAKKACDFDMLDAWSLSEDTLKNLFGDHVKVNVDVLNKEITTEEYDHD